VKDDTGAWRPLHEGHGERVFDQFGAHVIGERPADDAARGQVDDRGQVGPALPGRDVGDVAHVAPVELFTGAEMALNQVLGRLGLGIDDRRRAPALLAAALEAGPAHEPPHPAPAALDPALDQFVVNPG